MAVKRRGLGEHSAIAAAIARPKAKAKAARTTVSLSREVVDRARDCAHHERLPLVALAEDALLREVARREAAHGDGFVYAPRPRRR